MLDVLLGKSLKFSSPRQFNDPFECRSVVVLEAGEAGAEYLKKGCRSLGLSPAKRLSFQKQLERKFADGNVMQGSNEEMDNLIERVGVSCFSGVKDSTLMWTHYASQHTGVCIGFDTGQHIFQTAWKVNYQQELPTIYRPTDDPDLMLQKSLLTKSLHWKYECEWRIIIDPA